MEFDDVPVERPLKYRGFIASRFRNIFLAGNPERDNRVSLKLICQTQIGQKLVGDRHLNSIY